MAEIFKVKQKQKSTLNLDPTSLIFLLNQFWNQIYFKKKSKKIFNLKPDQERTQTLNVLKTKNSPDDPLWAFERPDTWMSQRVRFCHRDESDRDTR